MYLFDEFFSFFKQHITEQFYAQNEMTIRGFAPKPILSFDEVQFPSKNFFEN